MEDSDFFETPEEVKHFGEFYRAKNGGEKSLLLSAVQKFLKKHSVIAQEVLKEPGSARLMEKLKGYDKSFLDLRRFAEDPIGFLIDLSFYISPGAKGLRVRDEEFEKNSIKYGKEYLKTHEGNELLIVSLGSGYAANIVKAVEKLLEDDIDVKFIGVDINPEVVDESNKRIYENKNSLKEYVKFIRGDVFAEETYENLKKEVGAASLIAIEGLFEYLDDRDAEKMMSLCERYNKPGGFFLMSNIGDKNFFHKLIEYVPMKACDWVLIHRDNERIHELLENSGYSIKEIYRKRGEWFGIGKKEKNDIIYI